MIAVEDVGHRLSIEELLATGLLLFLSGHETTTNLIGNRVLARPSSAIPRSRGGRARIPPSSRARWRNSCAMTVRCSG
jgi:hypothetical protein